MPPTNGKRTELQKWLDDHRPGRIGENEFLKIHAALAPISESYLQKLVRECGYPLHPMIEGVRQGNLDELETSLLALLEEYERSDRIRRVAVRRLVITGKDHARLAIGKTRGAEKLALKHEAILWLVTWLENPPLFREWVRLRRGEVSAPASTIEIHNSGSESSEVIP